MKQTIAILIAVLLLGGAAFYFFTSNSSYKATLEEPNRNPSNETTNQTNDEAENDDEVEDQPEERPSQEVIGTSAGGKNITAKRFGNGDTEILVIGGVHSAFAPNTTGVAEELINALESDEILLPENVTVTVIPNLNPDASGSPNTLASRLNQNKVDLNRNFDCEWEEKGVWRKTPVSGGSSAFSEPEAKALRDYVNSNKVSAAIVYYAAEGSVYASNCGGSLDSTIASLTSTYAKSAGYTANDEFDAYAISGDLTNWLAKVDVPAIGVLLSNYTSTEWNKNKAGIEAVIELIAE